MNAVKIIDNALKDKGNQAFWIRVYKVYLRAQKSRAAKESGIIGVGLITFAEHRVDVFLRRCGR